MALHPQIDCFSRCVVGYGDLDRTSNNSVHVAIR